jgi:hypothetical protein
MNQEFLDLFKRHQELRSKGGSLNVKNPTEFTTYLDYTVLISDHFDWLNRKSYFEVVNNFSSKKIDVDEYVSQFLALRYKSSALVKELYLDLERLKIFEPIKCPQIFALSMDYLYNGCTAYDPNPDEEELSEKELIQLTREILIDIQGDPTKVPDCYKFDGIPREPWEPKSKEKTRLYSQGDPTKAFDRYKEWGRE